MLRSTLCLLFTAVFMSVASAQQRQTDVQSLQYEFGQNVRVQPTPPPQHQPPQHQMVPPSCSCAKPVVYAPVDRTYCCMPCRPPCWEPYYNPCYYPVKHKHRRAVVRPVYPTFYRW